MPRYSVDIVGGDLIVTANLGPVDGADPELIPPGAWPQFVEARDRRRNDLLRARERFMNELKLPRRRFGT